MVLQIAPDARQLMADGDAQALQHVARPDAGELQELRRADGAGGEHDLGPRGRGFRPVAPAEGDTGAAAAVEQKGLGLRAGEHHKVWPASRRPQEGLGGGPADATALGHVEVAAALVVAAIEIVGLGDAALLRGVAECVQDLPADPGRLDAPLAAGAVELAGAQPMVLGPLEQGQDVVPGPAGIAELAPMVVVGRLAAHVDHAVDGRAAAQDLAARIVQRTPVQAGIGLRLEAPIGARVAHGVEVADGNVDPVVVVAATRLQQQDAVPGVGGKPVRQHAARRAGTDDDVVEFPRCLRHRPFRRYPLRPGASMVWSGSRVDGGVAD